MSETPVIREASTLDTAEENTSPEPEPDSRALGWFARLLARFSAGDAREDTREIIEEALENEAHTAQSFSPQERLMMGNLLRFGARRVEDVMVPRADIVAIDNCESLAQLLQVFQRAGHSRIPIYEGTLDDPRGIVHIKDLVAWIASQAQTQTQTQDKDKAQDKAAPAPPEPKSGKGDTPPDPPADGIRLESVDLSRPIAEAGISREILYVPPSMPGLDLLLRMQTTHIHLALVVDEYGGTDGLVSIEDLVEEIVGEIEDEHDQNDTPLIMDNADGELIAGARTPIEELEERLGLSLQPASRDANVDTLGGLVIALAGCVPVRGELIRHDSGIEFEVLDADARRIKKLKIHRNRAAGQS